MKERSTITRWEQNGHTTQTDAHFDGTRVRSCKPCGPNLPDRPCSPETNALSCHLSLGARGREKKVLPSRSLQTGEKRERERERQREKRPSGANFYGREWPFFSPSFRYLPLFFTPNLFYFPPFSLLEQTHMREKKDSAQAKCLLLRSLDKEKRGFGNCASPTDEKFPRVYCATLLFSRCSLK